MSVSKVVRAVVERERLTVGHLVDLMANADGTTGVEPWDGESVPDEPVTYIGLERPEGPHPDSRIITLENPRAT